MRAAIPTAPAFVPPEERIQIHIANPKAGGGLHLAAAETAVKNTGGILLLSEHPGHLTELIRESLEKNPYPHFVVYGGDGTVYETVNALMSSEKHASASFSIIPTGSGNDFSAYVNDSGVFPKKTPVKIDVIRTYSGGETRCFANMMNIGFDCAVVRKTDTFRKNPLFRGSTSYIAGVAATLFQRPTENVTLTLSGCVSLPTEEGAAPESIPDRTYEQRILLTAAGNCPRCGGGFHALPLADPTDGFMDVLVANVLSRVQFVSMVGDYRRGTYLKPDGELLEPYRKKVEFTRCTRLRITGPQYFCLDGEVFPTGEDRTLEAEVVPGALWVIPV